MSETSETPRRRIPPMPRFARVVFAVALVLLVALIALWLARRPIATHFIDRELARRGIPARYHVGDFGAGRQRLTDVVIGDPNAPDLVADWIETEVAIGLSGATLTGMRAGHVRLRGRLIDGRVSLGSLDRLMPPPSGKPFALPALDLDVADVRMRLETPQGLVGLKLAGQGRLDDGFRGTLAAVSPHMVAGGCAFARVQAAMRIAITRAAPTLDGPVRLAHMACGGARVEAPRADLTVALTPALDHWHGSARLATGGVAGAGVALASAGGTVDFDGAARMTAGHFEMAGRTLTSAEASAPIVGIAGDYRVGKTSAFTGQVMAQHARLAPRRTAPIARLAARAAGSPVAPLAERLAAAAAAAARDVSGQMSVEATFARGKVFARIGALSLAAANGATLRLRGGSGVALAWPSGATRVDSTLAIEGGGMPTARIALAQAAPGEAIRGRAVVAPYAAGAARLALTPVVFSATPSGATRITTSATLDGPLGDGRVEGATLAIDAGLNARGTIVVNPRCADLSFRRLALSGLDLRPARIPICPTGAALLTVADGRLGGGARLGATRLAGSLGSTPLALAASGADVSLARAGFAVRGVQARLGAPERVTRLDFADLSGTLAGGGFAGRFAGGGGQIANVPLLLSQATGDWSFRGGALGVTGAMTVADAAPDPRFKSLAARTVSLTLRDDVITATGTLEEQTRGVKVADVAIRHVLASGTGGADLTMAGITFGKEFQPDLLTRLTYGVIADVAGTVSGAGRIDWSPAGVTSTGVFRTAGTDLAAAFGPVTRIAGEIRFTDLLALESAPHQVATVKSINPGIVVENGTITYRALAGTRVQVEGGSWPFAGGTLALEPTLLDFANPEPRRMTFRVEGAAADKFLQQFAFENIDATGTFDGVLPMIFDTAGGRIEGGRLAMRQGGGTLAYNGDLTQKDLGFWGNLAFQSLRSLRYRSLAVTMNGPLAGEMVTEVRFAGVNQGKGAKSNFLIRRLQKLPFVFNIRIRAPFRGLLDSAQSFYDPSRLIQRNLPTLLDAQQHGVKPIQPPASGVVP